MNARDKFKPDRFNKNLPPPTILSRAELFDSDLGEGLFCTRNDIMDTKASRLLDEMRAAYKAGATRSEIWQELHDLAEASYAPAIQFFESFLEDPDWDWRLEGIQLLGFHYTFHPDSGVVKKFRNLLLTDLKDLVRAAAASALGNQLVQAKMEPSMVNSVRWPDHTLLVAMQSGSDMNVRYASFRALLLLAGMPPLSVQLAIDPKIKAKIQPTLEDLVRDVKEAGLDPGLLA